MKFIFGLVLLVTVCFTADCENSGDVEVLASCQCGGADNLCSIGQYCVIDGCVDYPRCQCHSAHTSVKSVNPNETPACKDALDPSCEASKIGDDGGATCADDEATLCIIAIPPCDCLNVAAPWSPNPVIGTPGLELNKFSCFDPQYRAKAERTEADVFDADGVLVHRFSDGKHRCFDEPAAHSAAAGLCTGTTRRRCRMPADATSPPTVVPTSFPTPDPTVFPTFSTPSPTPAPTLPPTFATHTVRGEMTLQYGVNIKTPQIQMGIGADDGYVNASSSSSSSSSSFSSSSSSSSSSFSSSSSSEEEAEFFQELTLDGNFDDINDEALWLSECSTVLAPARCDSIRPGSIIVDVKADNKDALDNACAAVATNGLTLPTFGSFTQKPTKKKVDAAVVEAVDGAFTDWGDCSVTCGEGEKTRTCDNPAPANGGADCDGEDTESCTLDDCPQIHEMKRRISSSQWFKSSIFFGAALAAIGFGFGVAGYYTTKIIFKKTADAEEQN